MRSGEAKKNLSPVEGILGSVAACMGVDIAAILKKKRRTVSALTLVTDGTRREQHPRAIISIHCKVILESPDATPEELEKATRLAKENYCSVSATLKPEIELSFEVVKPQNHG